MATVDYVKDPNFITNIDSTVRRYNLASNMLGIIPKVGVNNRFMFSPRSLGTESSIYGLLDKTMVMPFDMDSVAIYSSLRNYTQFPIRVTYDFPEGVSISSATLSNDTGEQGNVADFSVVFAKVPPISTDSFMNGVRGIDAEHSVTETLAYARGLKDDAELWAPLWNDHTAPYSNSWGNSYLCENKEYGMRCGSVHILESLDYYGTATERNGVFSYVTPDYERHEISATIDNVFDWIYHPISVDAGTIDCGPLSSATTVYKVVPATSPSILDFMVSFDVSRDYSYPYSTHLTIGANVPKKVAFTNLAPYPIELAIFCHPYNWYFTGPDRDGRYRRNDRCRNNLTIMYGTVLENAKTFADARSPANTFYDFGTGLKAYIENGSNMKYNLFELDAFETKTLIDIDEADIFRSDRFTSENIHGWDGLGWKYESSTESTISQNPYNSGCYGFWIDLKECFFRLKKN